jgi:hypothetical protein
MPAQATLPKHGDKPPGPSLLSDLARRLASSGLGIADLGLRRPSFEDVFLALTSHPGPETARPDRVGRIRAKIPATSCSGRPVANAQVRVRPRGRRLLGSRAVGGQLGNFNVRLADGQLVARPTTHFGTAAARGELEPLPPRVGVQRGGRRCLSDYVPIRKCCCSRAIERGSSNSE